MSDTSSNGDTNTSKQMMMALSVSSGRLQFPQGLRRRGRDATRRQQRLLSRAAAVKRVPLLFPQALGEVHQSLLDIDFAHARLCAYDGNDILVSVTVPPAVL